jgi:hypothetical protein
MPFHCCDLVTTLPRTSHDPAILRECQTGAGRPHDVSGRQMLIHTYHAVPMPRLCRGLERSLSDRHIHSMGWVWHGNGMACVKETRPHCVNQMGKTQSKHLAEQHGREKAWERHGMRESCLRVEDSWSAVCC